MPSERSRSAIGRMRPKVASMSLAGQFEQPHGPMRQYDPTVRIAGHEAFAEAGITHQDVDHLMIYDAFVRLPIYGLEDLGFVPRGEAGAFIARQNTAPGGKLPLNTNGDLSYMHSGMYGMYALQGSVRQMPGQPPPRSPTPRSRSATASAACSPRRVRVRSSCSTSRPTGDGFVAMMTPLKSPPSRSLLPTTAGPERAVGCTREVPMGNGLSPETEGARGRAGRALQPEGDILRQIRCRCSDERWPTPLVIVVGRTQGRRLGVYGPGRLPSSFRRRSYVRQAKQIRNV